MYKNIVLLESKELEFQCAFCKKTLELQKPRLVMLYDYEYTLEYTYHIVISTFHQCAYAISVKQVELVFNLNSYFNTPVYIVLFRYYFDEKDKDDLVFLLQMETEQLFYINDRKYGTIYLNPNEKFLHLYSLARYSFQNEMRDLIFDLKHQKKFVSIDVAYPLLYFFQQDFMDLVFQSRTIIYNLRIKHRIFRFCSDCNKYEQDIVGRKMKKHLDIHDGKKYSIELNLNKKSLLIGKF